MRHPNIAGAIGFFIIIAVAGGVIDIQWPGHLHWDTPSSLLPAISAPLAPPLTLGRLQPQTRLAALLPRVAIGPRSAAAAAATATATPDHIAAGQPTEVTVTIPLTDQQLIPESVNLQRVDASGKVVAVLGTLHDSGLHGDATPGDRVFTLRQGFTEAAPTPILLRVSWAAKGSLGRAVSNTLRIEVR